jgi:hypothetical protein
MGRARQPIAASQAAAPQASAFRQRGITGISSASKLPALQEWNSSRPLESPVSIHRRNRGLLAVFVVLLAGCGAEVAGTAATVGSVQATQARQAQEQKKAFDAKLDEALKATAASASAADPR